MPRIKKDQQPLHKTVAEILSERIFSGEFPENSYLPPERELVERLGVSRTVIREAIKLMESKGLIRIERGVGTAVAEARHDRVAESLKVLLRRKGPMLKHLIEVRALLEVGMTGLAAQRRTQENLAAMGRCLEIMRKKPSEPTGYVDADVEFHSEIARAAQNPALLLLLEPLSDLLRESRIVTFSGPQTVRLRIKQHEEIYQMIQLQDVEGAKAAMNRHLADTAKDLQKHWKKLNSS